jgi:hypothetical protein
MSEIATYNVTEYGSGSVVDLIEEHRETQWKHLDHELKMFAYEYLKDYDHAEAAKLSGVGKKNALKTLRNPLVQAFIQDIMDDRQVSTNITQDYVTTMWMKLLPKLMGEEDVHMVTSSGAVIEEKKFFASESISALREMSKSTKFYEDGSGGVNFNLSLAISSDMTKAEASQEYMKLVQGERVG